MNSLVECVKSRGLSPNVRGLSPRSGGLSPGGLKTVYFGGGSPALCDLRPLFEVLGPFLSSDAEFTVELHPLDVTRELLTTLRAGGVNRISMGVQSLDDAVLADMGRGYTFIEAERAFESVKSIFDNAGIDLIVGYPKVGDRPPKIISPSRDCGRPGGPPLPSNDAIPNFATLPKSGDSPLEGLRRLKNWGLRHCSVYSLILEEKSILGHRLKSHPGEGEWLPSDDETLDALAGVARFLKGLGLERYEISNYAVPGYECRHNLAVWRGEDYWGLGEGACGRIGLTRTVGTRDGVEESVVEPDRDDVERRIFRLRTSEGLDATDRPEWEKTLADFVGEGLLTCEKKIYRLTARGTEVCDSILAELI